MQDDKTFSGKSSDDIRVSLVILFYNIRCGYILTDDDISKVDHDLNLYCGYILGGKNYGNV